jgi:hypothetical protein
MIYHNVKDGAKVNAHAPNPSSTSWEGEFTVSLPTLTSFAAALPLKWALYLPVIIASVLWISPDCFRFNLTVPLCCFNARYEWCNKLADFEYTPPLVVPK